MNNVLQFDGIVNFSAFINPLTELKRQVPQLSVLCDLGQSLGRGCNCNKNKRKQHAEKAYENILNYLSDKDVSIIKGSLEADKIVFKLNGITVKEI